jgi:hypothetical protein
MTTSFLLANCAAVLAVFLMALCLYCRRDWL